MNITAAANQIQPTQPVTARDDDVVLMAVSFPDPVKDGTVIFSCGSGAAPHPKSVMAARQPVLRPKRAGNRGRLRVMGENPDGCRRGQGWCAAGRAAGQSARP